MIKISITGRNIQPITNAFAYCSDHVHKEKFIGIEWGSRGEKIDWMFENITGATIHFGSAGVWDYITFKDEKDWTAFLLKWT